MVEQTVPVKDGLWEAVNRARKDFNPINKNCTNPHFKMKYADLASIYESVVPALSNVGVVITHPIETNETSITVGTRLIYGDYSEVCSIKFPYVGTPQTLGSLITYGKRYTLSSILAVAAEDDDDGNSANDQQKKAESDSVCPKCCALAWKKSTYGGYWCDTRVGGCGHKEKPPKQPIQAITTGVNF